MTTHIAEVLAADIGTTRPISVGKAARPHSVQVVRKLAVFPASLYNWLSGPAMSDQTRSRAVRAEAMNSQGLRGLFL